jgi:transporter family-2 protein
MFYLFIILGLVVGSLLPWQPLVNSRLGQELASPLWGAFLSFATGALILGALVLAQGKVGERVGKLTELPMWMYSGGLMGAMFVGASIFLIPRIGATSLSVSFILGQIAMSVFMDHFGWGGLSVRTIDASRAIGILLFLLGLYFIVRPQHAA